MESALTAMISLSSDTDVPMYQFIHLSSDIVTFNRLGLRGDQMHRLALLCLLVLCAGCATVTRGSTQSVSINAPQGAICTLSSPAFGTRTITAPNTVVLEKGSDHVAVHCKKACYRDGIGKVESSLEEMTAGNI